MEICVIGLGSMGKRRIRLLKKIKPDIKISGIDSNQERGREVAEKYAIDVCFSLKELKTRPDCVFICTPPQTHGILIQTFLQENCHVFSEINLVDDLYRENMRLAREKQRVLFLSSTPLYREEIQIIDKKVKETGKTCAYQYHVGQYLPDWHPWDELKDFFVSNRKTNGCREFLAIEMPWIQNTFGKIRQISVIKKKLTMLDLDFPDTYLLQFEHENGNVGNVAVDVISRQAVRHLEVFNEELYLKWDGKPDLLYEKNISSGILERIQTGVYIHEKGYADVINEYAYERETEDFFEVIKGKKPVYDFEQDMETLHLIDRIEGWE